MAKDRPWNRQSEPEHRLTKQDAPNLTEVGDEQVRAYCLEKAREYLYRNQIRAGDVLDTRDLEIAAHYAVIAQAFRSDPEPE